MASTLFCASPRETFEPATLQRQNSGIGDAYSVLRSSESVGTVSRYHDEPEVDYDLGATELYRRIEARDWDNAMTRLESHAFEAKTCDNKKKFLTQKIGS